MTKITKALKTELEKAGFYEPQLKEMAEEGFPPYMVQAFLLAATQTKTIISSRTPGGAGIDLIAANYDLKGFQIKCKSCDWGPMAGFICQLPFFNKSGFENIEYNTKYIKAYLASLAKFSGIKTQLKAIEGYIANVKKKISFAGSNSPETLDKLCSKVDELREGLSKDAKEYLATIARTPLPSGAWPVPSKDATDEASVELILSDKQIRSIYTTIKNVSPANTPEATLALQTFQQTLDELLELFNVKVGLVVKAYRQIEQATPGQWSGENTLPAIVGSPFIALQGRYTDEQGVTLPAAQVVEVLKKMNGIDPSTVKTIEGTADEEIVTGTAYNMGVPYALKKATEESTIKVHFLLVKGKDKLWSLYHGDIFYREPTKEGSTVKKFTDSDTFIKFEFGASYQVSDRKLFALGFAPDKNDQNKLASFKDTDMGYVNTILSRDELKPYKQGEVTYYRVRGIMNPHPPHPAINQDGSDNLELCKNAVSGDYDIFAFWPAATRTAYGNLLTRLTEQELGESLKTAFDAQNTFFLLEFIPGFTQIEKLLESPETGNISSLGGEVCAWLNSLASKELGAKTVTNKAFHSDEGGRPGIMEIEFPVAFFFPADLKTNTGVFPKSASATELRGGLVHTAADLVQLMLDIVYVESNGQLMLNKSQYDLPFQSEWLMHLFFIALAAGQDSFNTTTDPTAASAAIRKWFDGKQWFQDAQKRKSSGEEIGSDERSLKDREKEMGKKVSEFVKIKKAHDEAYLTGNAFDAPGFKRNLKKLLRGTIKDGKLLELNDATYNGLEDKLLELAFYGNKPAQDRKAEVIRVLYAAHLEGD
jgi:hypothetical protein